MKSEATQTQEPAKLGSPQDVSVKPQQKIEVKLVRHNFTSEERLDIGQNLATALAAARDIEAELDSVKASFKARTAEVDARINSFATSLSAGFEMRNKRCRVEFKPKERRKLFFLEDAPADTLPVMIEQMTGDDFQIELIQAESKFGMREEIVLFPPAGNDSGVMVVGRWNNHWFAALRVKVGSQRIEERLDSEQPSTLKRSDAITKTEARLKEWLLNSLGKDAAKGFDGPIEAALKPQREREE